jgi:hypothetical protein
LRRDLRAFVAHAGVLVFVSVVASCLALSAEAVAVAVIPALWGGGGPVYHAIAIPGAAAASSRRFGGRWLALDEWLGAAVAVGGAVLATRAVAPLESPDAAAVARSVLFLLAVQAAVIVLYEFAVWRAAAPSRVRATDQQLYRITRGQTSSEADLSRRVRSLLLLMSHQSTAATAPLHDALEAWYARWLAAPEGLSGPDAERLSDGIEAAMIIVYGPRVGPRPD